MNNLQDTNSLKGEQSNTPNERIVAVISSLKYLAVALIGVLLPIGIYLYQTSSPSAEQVTIEPLDTPLEATTTNEVTTPPETVSATSSINSADSTYGLYFTREDIKVGNKLKMSPDQVRGSYANITERVGFDYTVTSVKQITIPEKNVDHTAFQTCYFYEKQNTNPECQVFVMNTKGVLFAVEYPTWGQSISKAVDDDVLNIKHKHRQLSIRPEEYPYIYQVLECGHSSFESYIRSGCFLTGEDIDTSGNDSEVILLVAKGLRAYDMSGKSFMNDESENYSLFASKKIDGQLIEVSLNVTVTDKQTKAKSVRVEVKKGNTGEKPEVLLETEILTSDEIELEYDYENRANKVVLIIGARRYIYDFANQTFYDLFEKLQSKLEEVPPRFVEDTESALNAVPKILPPDEHEVRTILSDLLYPPESTQDFILKGYGKRFVLHSGVTRKDGRSRDATARCGAEPVIYCFITDAV